MVEISLEQARGRVPVLAGAGGLSTQREVIEMIAALERLGVSGILSVTPYYNKPTQEGLYQHYRAIAESTRLPSCCIASRAAHGRQHGTRHGGSTWRRSLTS